MRNKETKNGLKRNHVVRIIDEPVFPARVWKILDDEHVIVICCGLHVQKFHIDKIEKIDYKGWWNNNHFIQMSRLRGLKKRARNYNPELIPSNTKEYREWLDSEDE